MAAMAELIYVGLNTNQLRSRVGHTIPTNFLDAPVDYHLVDSILDKTLLRVNRTI